MEQGGILDLSEILRKTLNNVGCCTIRNTGQMITYYVGRVGGKEALLVVDERKGDEAGSLMY